MSMRTRLSILIYGMVNAVLFGIGIITVMTAPPLASHATVLVPIVVVASLVLAVPVAWVIAPRLRRRYWLKNGRDPWGLEPGLYRP